MINFHSNLPDESKNKILPFSSSIFLNIDFQSIYNKKQLDQSGLTHISLTVHNLDETYSILKERGIEFNCPPTLSVNQNLKVTFCRDFEGNFLELTEEIP